MLDKTEVAYAMEAVKKQPAGFYTVRELYSDAWPVDHRPRNYGRRFKAAVVGGTLPGVRWVGKKSNNCLLYQVGAAAYPWDEGALGDGSRTGSRSPGHIGS